MKKRVFTALGISFVCVLILFACRKSSRQNLSDSNRLMEEILQSGQLHNEGLVEVSKLSETDRLNPGKIRETLIKHNEKTSGLNFQGVSFSINDRQAGKNLDWIADYGVGSYAGASARIYIKQLGAILSRSSFENPELFSTEIQLLIKNVSANNQLTLPEKGLILGTASVANSSYTFWRHSYSDTNSPFHKLVHKVIHQQRENSELSTAYPDWLTAYIYASDAAGYVGGYNMIMNATDESCKADYECNASQIRKAKDYGVLLAQAASVEAATKSCCNPPS